VAPRASKNTLAAWARACAATSLVCVSGCGGSAVPLLHPAHTLPAGRTAFAVGVSDRFVLGDAQHALEVAEQPTPPGTPPGDAQRTRGLLIAVAEGPAVAPYAAARVGIPGTNEAGLSYSGHGLRADLRHAFEWDASALSMGLGLSALGIGQSTSDPPGTDLSGAHGVGVDLPILVGYRTDADLISVWGGLRGSFDHWSGTVSLDPNPAFALDANRFALGPIFGMSLGLPPFWVSAELELDYAHVAGSLDRPGSRYDAQLNGWSARPAGALVAKF